MALLLLEKNNYARLFWNPCINVEVIAQISSIYCHFIIWPSSVTLTFNLPEHMFQMALLLLKKNNCAKLFWNLCINVGFMAETSSIYVTFKCDIDLQPTLKKVSNGTSLPQGDNYAKIFWKPCINAEVMAWINPDWCTHARTYTEQKL